MSFEIGDVVRRPATGEQGVVRRVGSEGMVQVAFPKGGARYLDVAELEAVIDDPVEALRAGEIGRAVPYGLRLQSLFLQHAYRYDPLAGLSNARIEPALHQIYVAHRVVSKLRPRMILADEVGLGKTVEAGLILKELRARRLVDRVLIVTPASLQHQWRQELSSKFNEDFEIIDGPGARFLGRGGENPWAKKDNVICSINLASNDNHSEKIVEAGWDMVIFDEAHRVRRRLEGQDRVQTTKAYALADELKELTFGFLLLSATPMQLHPFELYSLVELVEPGLYPGFDDYERRRRELPQLNQLMRELLRWNALTESERRTTREKLAKVLDGADIDLSDDTARVALMDRLVHFHPLADVLVRNRKAEIGGFTSREAKSVIVTLTDEERQLYDDVSEYIRRGYDFAMRERRTAVGFLMVLYQQMLASSSAAIRASFGRRVEKLQHRLDEIEDERTAGAPTVDDDELDEMRELDETAPTIDELEQLAVDEAAIEGEIAELEALIARLGKSRDSKARELLTAVRAITARKPDEKILVFTRYLDTQHYLRRAFEGNGYDTVIFNGQMPLDLKEEAVRAFKGDAQIMITTEAGGEGRNFQFAHFMFNYDLPWNPMRVEQRIGRLDRIGQRKPVYIYNLACEGTVEERILEVLANRIGLFKESVGALDPILGEVERDIEQLVLRQAHRFDEAFEEYAEVLEARVAKAREHERIFADFILDRASFRRDRANDLVEQGPIATHADLRLHVASALEYFGGRMEPHPDGGEIVHLAPRLTTKMGFRNPAHRGVFDPQLALQREDLDFFAFGHELVDKSVALSVDGSLDITTWRQWDDAGPGTFVEFFWQIVSESLDPSGVMLHHLVSENGEVREFELREAPPTGTEVWDAEIPSWVDGAFEASWSAVLTRVDAERARVQRLHRVRQDDEIERARRVHEYRKIRLQGRINEQAAWIEEKQRTGTERERRVLPARQGKLRQERQRLETLDAELESRIERVEEQRADVSPSVLAAGIVIGS